MYVLECRGQSELYKNYNFFRSLTIRCVFQLEIIMFISKLRLLSSAYHRSNVVQETIRKTKINFPAISQTVRTYARFIDDDDYDAPVAKTRIPSSGERSGGSYGQRGGGSFGQRSGSYGQRDGLFGQLSGSFGQRGGSFGQRGGSFGQQQQLKPIRYNLDELEELRKDFYQPSEITENRTEEEIEEYRRKHEISVPRDAPKPILTFNELKNLPQNVAMVLKGHNFEECTPIQAQGMPIALSGKNMVGIAQTG